MTLFYELTIIFVITFLIALIFRILKQPLIISYLVSGLLLGTLLSSFFEKKIITQTFADLGIALLLFIVGLELKLKTIREIGVPSLVIGGLQEIVTILIGFIIVKLLGFSTLTAFYLGAALSFSSTIIVVKLIADKGDLEKVYGKLAIGFLLVQDLITILIIIGVTFFSNKTLPISSFASVDKLLAGGLLLFLIPYFSQKFLPRLEKNFSKSLEFLFLFSLAFGFSVSSIFEYLGFGIEIGALLAGISLSSLISSSEIASRLKPLRDFFLIIFFIVTGSQIVISDLNENLMEILILSLFVLIGNPLIMFVLLGFLGYKKKTMFLLGLSSAQISEFSFILINLGIELHGLSSDLMSLLSIIGLLTIFSSSYLFVYADKIYPFVRNFLKLFERKVREEKESWLHYDVILFGCDRIGSSFLDVFLNHKISFLVVDHNLEIVKNLKENGVNVFYGDASEIDVLSELNLRQAKMVISTIPDFETNLLILEECKKFNPSCIFLAVAYNNQDALNLYDKGADYIIMPYYLGGEHAAHLVAKNMFNKDEYIGLKNEQINHIKKRINLGHHHPLGKIFW